MNKLLSIFLALAMAATLAACGAGSGGEGRESPAAGAAPAPSGPDTAYTAPEETPGPAGAEESAVLVACFSATGNTRGIVEQLQSVLNADLYEIVPAEPYSDEDLDYGRSDCRANQEQNDPGARPAIDGAVENMADYQVVFLGYPIWWGDAPRIISTFLESYDFSGKTIVPFCTSGSSGIGASADSLAALTEDAVWLEGTRFDPGAAREEVAAWVDGLGL